MQLCLSGEARYAVQVLNLGRMEVRHTIKDPGKQDASLWARVASPFMPLEYSRDVRSGCTEDFAPAREHGFMSTA